MAKKILHVIVSLAVVIVCAACAFIDGKPANTPADSSTNTGDDNIVEDTVNSDSVTSDTTEQGTQSPTQNSQIIEEIIDKNLDIILADGELLSSEQEYIDAHPEAFAEIVSLGEAALPYLDKVSDNIKSHESTIKNCRSIMAMYAAYTINPEQYDKYYLSPNENYAIKATVSSFFQIMDPFYGIAYNLSLIDMAQGIVMASAPGTYNLMNIFDLSTENKVWWSLDSNYAVFEDGYRHMYTSLILFDAKVGSCMSLPAQNELEAFIGEELIYIDEDNNRWDQLHCYFAEWDSNSVKVTISLAAHNGGRLNIGFYIYDLVNHCISDICVTLESCSHLINN